MDVHGYLEQIDEGARRLSDSAEWRRWLDWQRQFHSYSASNCWLIVRQCPTASMVAGYVAWQHMGRQVRKGELGIRILAPMIVSARDPQDPERMKVAFRVVSVFDISQTDGEPIPEPAQRIATSGRADLYARLVEAAEGLGYHVSIADAGTASGWVDYAKHEIVLAEGTALDHHVKTMAHELGHILCEHTAQRGTEQAAQQELEAESVAYCLCAEAGMDTGDYSFAYVKTWAGEGKDVLKALKASATIIAKAVKTLWEMVEGKQEQAASAA